MEVNYLGSGKVKTKRSDRDEGVSIGNRDNYRV